MLRLLTKMKYLENGIGIDLGSSSVRVGLFDLRNDQLIAYAKQSVNYHYNEEFTLWQYTQSTKDVMTAIETCFANLQVDKHNIQSCGVSATCSMALFIKKDGYLHPYNSEGGDQNQNVVFWMDSTSTSDCERLNNKCENRIKEFIGGKFIPEMAIPKIKRLADHLKSCGQDSKTIIAMDLHRYLAYELARRYKWDYSKLINNPNHNGVGHDGELSGWDPKFYQETLKLPPYIIIGPELPPENNDEVTGAVVASCIDCYSSWLSLCSPYPEKSLFVVGGTSTCYLYATELKKTIPGVWGPFSDILDETNTYAVYEGGLSCSGRLLEHLFQTHSASSSISRDEWPLLLEKLEEGIKDIESETGQPIYYRTKHLFFYGDFQGNRTPYADPDMSGMIIGETTDISFSNLMLKYISVLEFLAFQMKYMVDLLNDHNNIITEIRICGSQAKNSRLLSLVKFMLHGITIKIPNADVDMSGVSGAYLLGKSSFLNKAPIYLIREKDDQNSTTNFTAETTPTEPLLSLLNTKYQIHLDMAKLQIKYRKLVDNALDV